MNKRKFLIGLSVAGALVFGGTLSFASMRDADTAQVNKLAIESKQVNTEAKQTNIEATPVDTNAIESGVDTNSVATNEVATNEVATEASNAPAEVTNEVQKQLLVSPAPEEKVATVKEASNDVAKAIDSQNSCSNACPSTCANGCNQGCESTCVNECNQGCQSTYISNSTKENNTCSNSNGCSKVKVIQGENVDNTTNGTCPTQSTTNTCPNTNE
ncbi:hypothetical protein KPL39_12425 [Clostridium gasigenes]|uniref:hypothetical protein n=1 Tax=Clostridium gasigenes TaxID=94869 RepID=UPI001C0BF88A|nr:hypothetical protein [Clostridium gasigenes]MBU3137070.1 hypothetical protein [Clostridium gasigenes]